MSVLTRIKNNQITDSTILANTKIVPGSIVGSLFNSNLVMTSDVTITGNLTVQGASTYLTVASTNTYVNDPLIVMNNAYSGGNPYDLGFIFNRGTLQNQAIIWNEYNKEFRLVGTTETGTTYGNIDQSTFANLRLGNLTVDYATDIGSLGVVGLISAGSVNATGNVLADTIGASYLTASTATVGNISAVNFGNTGAIYTGASLNVTGNVVASTSIAELHTGSTATFGNIAAVTIGNVGTQFNGSAINLSGNVLASTVLAGLVTADDATFGNVNAPFIGNTGTSFSGASINVSGNVLASTVGASYVTASTATFGNISAVTIGNTGAYLTGATLGVTGNVIGGLAQFAAINGTPIGNAVTSTGAFTTLDASGVVSLTNTTNSTGPSTGALQVTGGVSIGGNLFVSGNLNIVGSSFVLTGNSGVFYGDLNGYGALYAGVTGYTPLPYTVFQSTADDNSYAQNNFQNLYVGNQATTDWVATSGSGNDLNNYIDMGITTSAWDGTQDNSLTNAVGANDGYLYVQGNITTNAGGNLTIGASNPGTRQVKVIVGGNTASSITAVFNNPGTAATTTTTGALTVAGGIGATGNVVVGGNLLTQGAATLQSTLTASGAVSFTNTTNSTSATAGGALTVSGGAAITKDLWVGGNVYAANIIGTSYQYLTIVDPLVNFRSNNTYPYSYDIGFYSEFVGGPANVEATTGIIRDNADGVWKFFSNAGDPTGGSVTLDGDTLWDGIKAGNLTLTNTTNASSNSTGALIVTGGAGIGASLYARDIQGTVIGNVTPAAGTFTTVNATGNVIAAIITAGSLNTTGNVSAATLNAGQINTTGNVLASTVGASYVTASTATFGNISAVTIGNTGAYLTGGSLNITGNALLGLTQAAAINDTPIGNASASTGAFTTISASAGIWANSSTDSTSTSTGSIVSAGGLGLAGNIFQGGAYHDTSASSGLLFNTPTTIDAFKSATNIEIGATTGFVLINNPSVEGSQATQNLFTSSLTTTMNFATKATSVTIAKPDSVTTIQGNANIRALTNSVTYTQGALVTAGGVGVAGNLNIRSTSLLTVGQDLGPTVVTNGVAQFTGKSNSSVVLQLQNLDSNGSASSDIFITNDTGTNILDMGVASSTYNDITFGAYSPSDSYIVSTGNLIIGTSNNNINDIVLHTGLYSTSNVIVRANNDLKSVELPQSTAATGTTSGALVVTGGVGIGANIWVSNGAVINNNQSSENFQVKGKYSSTLIYANSNHGVVVIGGSNAAPVGGATLRVNGTDSLLVPVGTTSQRPGNSGNIDVTGMLRYNTSINNLEWYDGSQWAVPGSAQTTVITDQTFTANGAQIDFTLASSTTTNSCIVTINGVVQIPTTAYAISGTTLTFTEAPADGDVIDVRKLTTTATINSLASANGYMVFDVSDGSSTYANITGGTSSATVRFSLNSEGIISLVNDTKIAVNNSATNILANATPYAIDSWTQTRYTSAKYIVTAKKDATNMETYEAIVLTDQSGNAFISTYGIVNNGTAMGTLSANVLGGNVQLYYTTSTNMTNANVKVYTTYIV